MITVAGASLIAQLIPVGLLVLAVEARAGYRRSPNTPKWAARLAATIVAVIAIFSLVSMFVCVAKVNEDSALDPFLSVVVMASAGALYAVSGAIATLLAFDVFRPSAAAPSHT